MSKQVLVTGGQGYIGTHCLIELLKQDYEPIVVDNSANSCSGNNWFWFLGALFFSGPIRVDALFITNYKKCYLKVRNQQHVFSIWVKSGVKKNFF